MLFDKRLLGAGAVAASLAASGPALAQQAGFRADADFVGAPSRCVEAEVHVFVRGLPNGRGQIDASVTAFDHCTETMVLDAHARGNLPNGALRLSGRNLTLDAVVQMRDTVSNNAVPMQFALEWVGGEEIAGTVAREVDAPGRRFVRLSRAERRTLLVAEATGSVSTGDQSYVTGPAEDAGIVLAR